MADKSAERGVTTSSTEVVYTEKPRARPAARSLQGAVAGLITLFLVVAGLAGCSAEKVNTSSPQKVVAETGATAEELAQQEADTKATADAQAAADTKAAADAKAAAERAAAARAAAAKAAAAAAAVKDAAVKAAAQKAAAEKAAADKAAAVAAGAQQQTSSKCTLEYPDFCIPPAGDYNCTDFSQKNFTALAPDPYGLDRDNDGIACES